MLELLESLVLPSSALLFYSPSLVLLLSGRNKDVLFNLRVASLTESYLYKQV